MSEESTLLGKPVAYPQVYSPEILVAVPRSLNREIYDIRKQTNYFTDLTVGMLMKLVFY